jgi:tRNA nucleotidyltransferase (CCA-adding enzyme)
MYTLSQYVSDVLMPTRDQVSSIPSKINKIANVIKDNTNLPLNKIILGGSYEKGTMLKHNLDVDLVLVFNKEPGISRNWKALIEKIYDKIKSAFKNKKKELGENIAVHLKFKEQNKIINFDIIPSYNVNSPLQMASVKNSKMYQGITSLWHIKYWKQKKNIRYITETVMLLKDWRNEHLKDEHEVRLKSFHMEIIAAYAYKYRLENKYTIETFLISCFKSIQGMIDGAPIFPVDWEYFDESSIINKHYDRPVLIDPANPKDNLLEGLSAKDARKIKSEAMKAMNNIQNENYGKVFDPKNKTKCFI